MLTYHECYFKALVKNALKMVFRPDARVHKESSLIACLLERTHSFFPVHAVSSSERDKVIITRSVIVVYVHRDYTLTKKFNRILSLFARKNGMPCVKTGKKLGLSKSLINSINGFCKRLA
jgi:hypothetical protein